mgnify:CR=1 FL=1|jgi:hypothetical protein
MSDIKDMYTFVENKDKTWTGIGLTEKAGKYQGVVYKYGKVSVDENKNNEDATLQFEWDMLDSNGLPKEMIGEDFFQLIGDILQDIILEQLDKDELQYVNTDNRKNDTQ